MFFSEKSFILPSARANNHRNIPLVGFVGLKRSGKDTAAQALVDRGWTRMAFADPLKDMSMKLRGVWVEVPEGVHLDGAVPVMRDSMGHGGSFAQYHYVVEALGMEQAKDLVPDVRRVLQTLGTDCVRGTFGPEAWVELAEQNIHEALTRGESVVLTDVRFDEELDLVRRLGGIMIGVWRGDLDSLGEALESEGERVGGDTHESETNTYHLLDWCDFIVCNRGSIDDLHRGVLNTVDNAWRLPD